MSTRRLRARAPFLVLSTLACAPNLTASDSQSDDVDGAAETSRDSNDGGSDSSTTGSDSSTTGSDDGSDDVGDTGPSTAALELPPGHAVNTERVATARVCEECHSNSAQAQAMRDEADRPIAPQDLWRASMMANAGRDPFWHAMVEGEILATPSAAEAIEAKCTRCHTPLLAAELELTNAGTPALATLYQDSDHAALALDGVSCTLCHQVEDQQLGAPASFDGGWVVAGEGRIFGPHADPFTNPMIMHTGMTPTQGDQLLDSALCGTCHTLFTDAMTPAGAATGETLAEQTPYLEWRNSAFSTEQDPPSPQAASCQDCHVPKRSIDGVALATRIARRPMGDDFPFNLATRSPVGRHLFVGGNTLMLGLIRDYAAVLRPDAPAAAFDATIAATRDQLTGATAQLTLAPVQRQGEQLQVDVTFTNLAGHKLPTGFPSRRVFAWIEVRDASDQLVFRSGAFDSRGRLLDGDGQILSSELAGGPIVDHRDQIAASDQVQIWEAIMADGEGQPTYRLLRGASYRKDNRLLPAGWDPQQADAAIAPVGVGNDPSFAAGQDQLRYTFTAPAAAGPYTVEVRAYYQPLSPRFLAELFALDGPRIRAFEAMLATVDLQPERLASAQTTAN